MPFSPYIKHKEIESEENRDIFFFYVWDLEHCPDTEGQPAALRNFGSSEMMPSTGCVIILLWDKIWTTSQKNSEK